jgi:hypothetical protein
MMNQTKKVKVSVFQEIEEHDICGGVMTIDF